MILSPDSYRDDDHIAEVFTSRMREIAERKEAIIRRPGSRPPWLLSKPRSLWVGGSAPAATNGTCRSVTYVTVATGSGPRREFSRAVSQTRRGTSRTATSLTPMTRRQLSCAESRRRTWQETVKPFLRSTRTKRGSGSRSGPTHLEEPKAEARKGSSPRPEGRDVAQLRGSVSVWLRPLAAALAWCAAPFPSACRRGPSGARRRSGLRPQGAAAPAMWLSRSWQQRPIPGR